jgi:S-adenosylmethionine:tRNA ribosyltransferase-isomerase
LESLYYLGCLVNENPLLETKDLFIQQWMPYEKEFILSVDESLKSLIHYFELNKISTLLFKTSILIVPGFTFRIVNGLITNFHQPKSTLLLLIAAFAGNDWKSIYDFALENQFRFLSFGDSSLLLPS